VLRLVPDDWLVDGLHPSAGQARAAYVDLLVRRLSARESWLEPLEVARAAR
jgi:hypothetical protein